MGLNLDGYGWAEHEWEWHRHVIQERGEGKLYLSGWEPDEAPEIEGGEGAGEGGEVGDQEKSKCG